MNGEKPVAAKFLKTDFKEEITMRKFIVNVNGNSYEVEVEEVGATQGAVVAAPVAAPAAAPAAAPKAAPAAVGGTPVKAPMPGTIVDIKVSNGAAVKEGDLLLIMEAMKMENEIFAPADGTVTVVTSKGASVNSGDVLITLS